MHRDRSLLPVIVVRWPVLYNTHQARPLLMRVGIQTCIWLRMQSYVIAVAPRNFTELWLWGSEINQAIIIIIIITTIHVTFFTQYIPYSLIIPFLCPALAYLERKQYQIATYSQVQSSHNPSWLIKTNKLWRHRTRNQNQDTFPHWVMTRIFISKIFP